MGSPRGWHSRRQRRCLPFRATSNPGISRAWMTSSLASASEYRRAILCFSVPFLYAVRCRSVPPGYEASSFSFIYCVQYATSNYSAKIFLVKYTLYPCCTEKVYQTPGMEISRPPPNFSTASGASSSTSFSVKVLYRTFRIPSAFGCCLCAVKREDRTGTYISPYPQGIMSIYPRGSKSNHPRGVASLRVETV